MENDFFFPPQEKNIGTNTENKLFPKVIKFLLFAMTLTTVSLVSYFLGTNKAYEKTQNNLLSKGVSPKPTLEKPSQNLVYSNSTNSSQLASPSATKSVTLTPTPHPPKTKVLSSTKSLDGFLSSNQTGSNNTEIRIGKNENLVSRGFISFDISTLPQGANILEATLRIYQAQVIGKPFLSKNSLVVDHLNFGDTLDFSDYSTPSLLSSFATISNDSKIGWKEIKVTNQLKDDSSNGRSRSQFRLHLQEETKEENSNHFLVFEASENTMGTGNTPELIVTYY